MAIVAKSRDRFLFGGLITPHGISKAMKLERTKRNNLRMGKQKEIQLMDESYQLYSRKHVLQLYEPGQMHLG